MLGTLQLARALTTATCPISSSPGVETAIKLLNDRA
jgi:hypothetical protein